MAYLRCRIAANRRSRALLELCRRTGFADVDHAYERRGNFWLEVSSREIERLERLGLAVVRVADLDRVARRRREERLPRRSARGDDDADDALTSGFVDRYMDASEVFEAFENLSAAFPALCSWQPLPEVTSGYDGSVAALAGPSDVPYLRITNTPAASDKPGFLLVCGTHAREWINPLVAVEFASQLLNNYDPASADPDVIVINRIVQEVDTFIVPVMNPDGLAFSFHDDAGWRKNRRPNPGALPGVDNNRNYSVFFGEAGSSDDPSSDLYHGGGAFSESENRNIRYLCEQHPNILIAVDSHSRGEDIFRPTVAGGTFTASLPVHEDDEAIYQDLEATAVAAIQGYNGKTYSTGTTSNHAGTSDEYFFFSHRIFGFDFECALEFQPPLADALESVQEVTVALRALGVKAADLDVDPASPVHLVQCIDRTGSMVALGYESGARANARRLVDLMSIGDSTAIVSFADPSTDPAASTLEMKSIVEHPLTELVDAGTFAAVQASIDAMAFGGWTSIGAGLQRSAELLAGATERRAIVLVSDGYENRLPSVAEVLPLIPLGVQVHTVALGPVADAALLADISAATSGTFHVSPTVLDLHEVYNQIRADSSDDDLILNARGRADEDDDAAATSFDVPVDPGARRVTFSLSWETDAPGDLVIISPSGRAVEPGAWGVTKRTGRGSTMVRVLRPLAGVWRLIPSGMSSAFVIAAFVRSAFRLEIIPQGSFLALKLRARDVVLERVTGYADLFRLLHRDGDPSSRADLSRLADAALVRLDDLKKPFPSKRIDKRAVPLSGAMAHVLPIAASARDHATSTSPRVLKLHVVGELPDGSRVQREARVTLRDGTFPPLLGRRRLRGHVRGKQIAGHAVRVEAFVLTGRHRERLGSSLLDESGSFEIEYRLSDVLPIDEKTDALIVKVVDEDGRPLVSVRADVPALDRDPDLVEVDFDAFPPRKRRRVERRG